MLGNVLGMLVGFMLGVLIRNSAGAIVGLLRLQPRAARRWRSCSPPTPAGSPTSSRGSTSPTPGNVLFNGSVTGEQWQHLAVSGTIWFLLPLAIGLVIVRRVRGQVAAAP